MKAPRRTAVNGPAVPGIGRGNSTLDSVGSENAGQELPQAYTASYVRYVLVVLAIVNLFSYMDRTALSVLMPLIKVDLELSDGQLGLLVGFAFFLFYALCGIPIARWADRGVRRNIISLMLCVWSVMTALSGAAQNFWQLLAARIGLGAGEAGCGPAAMSLISDYVPQKDRYWAFAANILGMFLGSMAGLILAGWLGGLIGWRWTFVALGLPGLILALIVRTTLREPARCLAPSDRADVTGPSMRGVLRALWSSRTYRFLVAFYVANGFAIISLTTWWPTFYIRSHSLSIGSVGLYLGLAIGIGAAIGTVFGGYAATKVAPRNEKFPLMMSAGAVALSLPAAVASVLISGAATSLLLAFIAGLLWTVPAGPALAAMSGVSEPGMRATANAVCTFILSVLGFGLGPFLVGILSDALNQTFGAEALRYALLLPALMLAVSATALVKAAASLPHDLLGCEEAESKNAEGCL